LSSPFRRTVRGMRDFLPGEAEKLRFIEQSAREVAKLYGYEEVITPLVENFELLAAKIGEENRKRMYVFEDLGGRKVALRPEFTASVARLVATKMQSFPKPLRLFSAGSLYRYDEPQFGRYREFWQANFELFGSTEPEADAEILVLTDDSMRKIGLRNYHFRVGHIGILRSILSQEKIGDEQQNRIMQLLDKKQWDEALGIAKEAGAPQECLDNLEKLLKRRGKDPEAVARDIGELVKDYPEALKALQNINEIIGLLGKSGAEIDLVLDAGFARGLEYYTGIVFEIYVPEMKVALAGGGRYDRLIELFGGGKIPGVGVAQGIDRMALALERQGAVQRADEARRVLVIPVGNEMVSAAFHASILLRKAGFCAQLEATRRSVARALSDAAKKGIAYAVIVGPTEMLEGKVVLRDMMKRSQETVSLKGLIEKLEG